MDLKDLIKIANSLDEKGHADLANELDAIIESMSKGAQMKMPKEDLGSVDNEEKSFTVEVVGVYPHYTARLVSVGREAYSGQFSGMVRESADGKYGWEALMNLAEGFKRAGFGE